MNLFSIGDIENLTNIKAHTLRIWEQRYGICRCKRKESSHRYYDDEDLKHILRIAWLYHRGLKISNIACLSAEEIQAKALGVGERSGEPGIFINRLMEASIDLNGHDFAYHINVAITSFGFEQTVLQILFPFLQKLGLFWLTGHVIPAQEHFASALITQKMYVEIDRLFDVPKSSPNRSVLLFSPIGEHHEIPLLFMHYLLRKNGVRSVYLGSSVSIETIQLYCSQHTVSEMYFHLITNLTRLDIDEYMLQLSTSFADKQIHCSGNACNVCTESYRNIHVLKSDDELLRYAMK